MADVSPVFDKLQFSTAQVRQAAFVTDKEIDRWQASGHILPGRTVTGGRVYSLADVVQITVIKQLIGNVGMPIRDAAVAADIAVDLVRDFLPTDEVSNKVLVLDASWSTLSLCLSKRDGQWCSALVDPNRPGYLDGDYGYVHVMLPFQQIASYAVFEVLNALKVAA